jgi:hypothetical protein
VGNIVPIETLERREQLAAMLKALENLKDMYYSIAVGIGQHQVVEIAGLIGELAKCYRHAFDNNIDFQQTPFPFLGVPDYMLAYMGEKIDCIFEESAPLLLKKFYERERIEWPRDEAATPQ